MLKYSVWRLSQTCFKLKRVGAASGKGQFNNCVAVLLIYTANVN